MFNSKTTKTKIVFHLGDHKTGSTSIQKALELKAWDCPGVKVSVPDGRKVQRRPLAMSVKFEKHSQHRAKRFKDMAAWIRKSNADIAIISTEMFEQSDPRALKDAVEKYMPEFAKTACYISYVRPHHARLVSGFGQRSKAGYAPPTLKKLYKETAANHRLDYAPRFEEWREVFGEQFTLRPFVRSMLAGQDVVQDFFELVFQDHPFELKPIPNSNVKICLQDIAMMHLMYAKARQMKLNLNPIKKRLARTFEAIVNQYEHPNGTDFRMHRALAVEVAEHYREDAAALDREFFDGTPMGDALTAAVDKAIAKPQSLAPEDCFDEIELRQINIWTDFFLGLIKHEDADWLKILGKARSVTLARVFDEA